MRQQRSHCFNSIASFFPSRMDCLPLITFSLSFTFVHTHTHTHVRSLRWCLCPSSLSTIGCHNFVYRYSKTMFNYTFNWDYCQSQRSNKFDTVWTCTVIFVLQPIAVCIGAMQKQKNTATGRFVTLILKTFSFLLLLLSHIANWDINVNKNQFEADFKRSTSLINRIKMVDRVQKFIAHSS